MVKSKKGSITDIPFLIAGIFTVTITAIIVTILLNNINSKIQDNSIFDTNAKDASEKMSAGFPQVMDGAIIFIFFLMVIISLVLASLVPIHPVFLIFYFLEWLLLIWIGAGIANAYQSLIENSVFAVEAGQYQLTTFFYRYFPYVIGVVGAILAIVMYKAKRSFIDG